MSIHETATQVLCVLLKDKTEVANAAYRAKQSSTETEESELVKRAVKLARALHDATKEPQ